MTTTQNIVHRYGEATGEAWSAFLEAMHSGKQFECDQEMFYYWLEVLPPRFMNRTVIFPDGDLQRGCFGFAEGAEEITAFWEKDGRYFGRASGLLNPGD